MATNLLGGLGGGNGNDMMNMLYASRLDPTTALGYKLGQYLGNYISRGQERSASNAEADQQLQSKIAQTLANNTTTGQNLSKAIDSFNALNPNNAGQGSDWNALGAKYGAVSSTLPTSNPGGLLSGIDKAAASQQIGGGSAPDFGVGGNLLDAVNSNGTLTGATGTTNAAPNTANPMNKIGTAINGIVAAGLATSKAQPSFSNFMQPKSDVNNVIQQTQNQQLTSNSQASAQAKQNQQNKENIVLQLAPYFFEPAASPSQGGAASQSADKSQKGTMDLSSINPYAGAGSPTLTNLAKMAASQPATAVEVTPAQRLASNKMENDLIRAKAAYQQAQDRGDTAGMQQAHDAANTIRNAAAAAGISLSSMDSGSTLQDAVNKKASDDYMQQIRDIVNPDKTSQEYYNEVYNRLRNQGYGYDVANSVASREAQNYQAQRISTLSSQFGYQGVAPSGAVNNLGVQVLTKLMNESPQTYQALASMYATPKDDYNFGRQIGLQNNNAANMLQNGLAMDKDKFQYNEQSANNNVGRQIAIHQAAAQAAEYYKNLGWQDRINMTARYLVQSGVPADQAMQQAIGVVSGRKNSSSGSKAPKWSEPVAGAFQKAISAIDAGDGGKEIDAFIATAGKYKPELDEDDTTMVNSMALALNARREQKAGHKQQADAYYEGIPDYLRDQLLPGYQEG